MTIGIYLHLSTFNSLYLLFDKDTPNQRKVPKKMEKSESRDKKCQKIRHFLGKNAFFDAQMAKKNSVALSTE